MSADFQNPDTELTEDEQSLFKQLKEKFDDDEEMERLCELVLAGTHSDEGDSDDVSLRLPGETLAGFEPGDAHSLFSLDYLSEIERPIPADCEVTLRLGSELPVELAYEADEGAVSVEYLLSPRLVRT